MKNLFICFALLFVSFQSYASSGYVRTDSTLLGYKIISQTKNIGEIKFKTIKKKNSHVIYLTLGNKNINANNENSSAYGIGGTSSSADIKNQHGPTIDKIKVFQGKYGDMTADKKSTSETFYALKNVEYPLNMAVTFGTETFVVEITQPGSYDIQVNLKK